MSTKLNPKQQRFVEEYLVDLHGTKAAIRAGYAAKGAHVQASRLLSDPKIIEAVAAGNKLRSEATGVTAQRTLLEFARIGYADIRRLMSWTGDRVGFKPSHELTDDEAASIAAVESETITRTDDDGNTETKIKLKLKLWDKPAALTQIGRHLGMFLDKTEHSGKIDGPPTLTVVLNGAPPGAA